MMPPLSSREFEQLSAYMDGQLSAQEQAVLKANLAERAELRAGLEILRQTRALLQHAPRRRVPRNFMLKPEMVPAKRRVFGRPVLSLGLASALATVFLLLSVMLEFVPLPLGASAPMSPVAQDSGAGRNLASKPPQPTQVAEMAKPASLGSPTSAPSAAPTVIQKAVEATRQMGLPLATATTADQLRNNPTDSTQQAPSQAPPPTKAPQPTQAMQIAPTFPLAATPAGLSAQPSVTPIDGEPKLGAQPTAESLPLDGVNQPYLEARKTLTWLQTLLVVLAASTGLAALYLRRRN